MIGRFARAQGASAEVAGDLILAVDELCSNVILHAFPEPVPPDAGFTVVCRAVDTGIEVVIRDSGPEFDVQNATTPTVGDWLRRGQKGGIGLKLVHMLVDSVHYQRVEGMNEVVVAKYLPSVLSSPGK
ncbi:MAG: ATP-binding protein [Cyanobacteria bacterium REEB65]|nr:ATP-binding protein [Cyanobacteria bacterium REEB65]